MSTLIYVNRPAAGGLIQGHAQAYLLVNVFFGSAVLYRFSNVNSNPIQRGHHLSKEAGGLLVVYV